MYDSLDFRYKVKEVNNLMNPTSTIGKSQTINEANLIYEEIGDNEHAFEVFIVSNDDSLIDKTKVKNTLLARR